MTSDQFHQKFDTPEAKRAGKARDRGNYILSNAAAGMGIQYLEPKMSGLACVISPVSKPITDAQGNIVDVRTMLVPRVTASLNMARADGCIMAADTQLSTIRSEGQEQDLASEGQYFIGPMVTVKLARFLGPKGGNKRIFLIDDHPAGDKAEGNGRTCLQSLCAEANIVLSQHPEWVHLQFYNPSDSFNSCLFEGTIAGLMLSWCWQHHRTQVGASPQDPVPCVFQLSSTASKSLGELVFHAREDYYYPEGVDAFTALSSREEQTKRFVYGDLCNPAGAPALIIQGVASAGFNQGNRYAVQLTQQPFQLTLGHHGHLWMEPEDLYYFPTFEETFNILLQSDIPEWSAFIEACARRVPRLESLVGPDRTTVVGYAAQPGQPVAGVPMGPQAPPAPGAAQAPPAVGGIQPAAAAAIPPAPAQMQQSFPIQGAAVPQTAGIQPAALPGTVPGPAGGVNPAPPAAPIAAAGTVVIAAAVGPAVTGQPAAVTPAGAPAVTGPPPGSPAAAAAAPLAPPPAVAGAQFTEHAPQQPGPGLPAATSLPAPDVVPYTPLPAAVAGVPADDPNSIEQRTAAARQQLEQMRADNTQAPPPPGGGLQAPPA